MKNLRGKSPAAVHHLVQKPCAGMLCLSGGVGVDVHSRINIRVPLQLLRTFGNRAIGEKTTGEGGDAACGNGSPSDLEPFLWLSGISV